MLGQLRVVSHRWPLRSDFHSLTNEEQEDFALTEFQYWNYSKGIRESFYNLPFRLFGTNNLKSEVIGSFYGTWIESPDGHLSTVNLSEVTKIEVYKNKTKSLSG